MSAIIYYLPVFERERLDITDAELMAEQAHPKVGKSGKKRYVRNPMPCGKNSKWKRKVGGKVERRD